MRDSHGGPIVDPTLWALAHLLRLDRLVTPAGVSDPVAPLALAQLLCGGLRFDVRPGDPAPLRGRRACADDLHLLQHVLREVDAEATFGAITPDVASRLGGEGVQLAVWVDRASLPWHGLERRRRGESARLVALHGPSAASPERVEVADAGTVHRVDDAELAGAGAAVPNGQGMAIAVVPPPIDVLVVAAERAFGRAVRRWALPSTFVAGADQEREDGPDVALALARDLLLSDGVGGGASGPLAGRDRAMLRDGLAQMWAFARHVEGDGCLGRRVVAEGVRVLSALRGDAVLREQANALFDLAATWREAIDALLPPGAAATQVRRRVLAYADAIRLGADPDAAHLLHDAVDAARRALVVEAGDAEAEADAREKAGTLWLAALRAEREIVASLADAGVGAQA